MALSLFRLTQFHIYEINRGRRNVGNFTLREGLTPLSDAIADPMPTEPNDIVSSLQNAQSVGDDEETTSTPPTAPTSSSPSPLPPMSSSPPPPSPDHQPTVSATDTSSLTTGERAAAVIRNGGISLDSKLAVFTVLGTLEPRVVRLFPSVTCSCPANGGCYHVKAAQMAIGIREDGARRPLNLTQLRKSKRKRPDKTSGRKRPRNDDVDVISAGDINDDELQQLQSAVAATADVESLSPAPPPPTPPATATTDATTATTTDSRCAECGREEPPTNIRTKNIRWIDCDVCHYWYHLTCTSLKKTVKHFTCIRCRPK